MGTPNISVVIEPSDGTNILYEPVAPNKAGDKASGIVCLQLTITNNGGGKTHLNKVRLSFSSPPNVSDKVITVPANWPGEWLDGDGNKQQGAGVNIDPGKSFVWNSLRQIVDVDTEKFENDAAVLPSPAPESVTLSLSFDGFDSPWKKTKPLAAHKNPVAGDAYLFPEHFDDLKAGEFWRAASNMHATGAAGSQLFGYDMGVFAYDPDGEAPGRLLPGKKGDKNSHYRVWGKKLYAMADGKVVHFLDGVGPNTKPGAGDAAGPWQEAPWDNDTKAWDDHVGAGNHFYIQHGDELVLYAHMQSGINASLKHADAQVKAGDLLGLAGNSGSSSEPHLHIHAVKGTKAEEGPLRPLLFRDMFTVDPAALSLPNTSGPWVRAKRQGPPSVPWPGAYIWPLGRHPEWRGWQDLGGNLTSAPAVASWAEGRLDVFAAGTDKQLYQKWWDGSAWHNWELRGGTFKGGPAAVSWGPHRIDVFVRGTDDHLGHLWWDGSQWKGWEGLGGTLTSAPAVASWAANRLDVFAAGSDKQLKHKWWDGSTWHNWENLGGTFKEAPAAVSWGPNRIDVFVRGMDDHLGHLWWNGSQWNGWQDLGGPIKSGPAVASWGPNRLDVFAEGADGNLKHKWWDGSAWSDWDWVGGNFQGNPAAVSWGAKRIDVFVRGTDDHLAHLWRG